MSLKYGKKLEFNLCQYIEQKSLESAKKTAEAGFI